MIMSLLEMEKSTNGNAVSNLLLIRFSFRNMDKFIPNHSKIIKKIIEDLK